MQLIEEMWYIFVDKASQEVSVVCFHHFTRNLAVVFEIHWKLHVASSLESRLRVIHDDMKKAFVAFDRGDVVHFCR